MAKLKLIETIQTKLPTLTKTDGQLIVIRDNASLYVDLDGTRMYISDWIDVSTDADRLAMLTPLSNKYYYVVETNKIWRYIGGSWIQITLHNASEVLYDNTTSGLSATNVNSAIDEISSSVDNLEESVAYISDESDVEASIGTVLTTQNIIDNVDSSSSKMVLSANQGKILNDKISIINEDVIELQNAKDITTTTSTTMPNSCEGRLLFKEIRGKTEQLTTTGKNLAEITLTSQTVNGVQLTVNDDKTITANGTATADTYFTIGMASLVIDTEYIISGCPNGGNPLSYGWYYDSNSTNGTPWDYGKENEPFTALATETKRCAIFFKQGTVLSNMVFKPMIRLASITDDTYEPYTGGVPATEPTPQYPLPIRSVEINKIKTHGKNLVEPIMNTMTSTGVTVTNNGDGSFTINGTSTDSVTFRLDQTNSTNDNLKNYKGTYTISVRDKSGNLNPSGIIIHLAQDVTYKSYLISDSVETAEIDAQNCFVFIHVKSGLTLNNLVIYPQLEKGMEVTEWEAYCGSSAILSKPIEPNGIGDVQDVIVDGKIIRRLERKVYDGSSDEQWFVADLDNGAFGIVVDYDNFTEDHVQICSHYKYSTSYKDLTFKLTGSHLYVRNTNYKSLAELKNALSASPITIIYQIPDTEVLEALPTADQVALNSVKTFDGTTYLEFDSPLEPEFVAEYGTSKVGGVALEAKGESQANGENIEVMNRILQDAFIPRETSNYVSDANTCLKSGIYRTYDDTANVKYTNGFLLVFAIDPNTMVVQINMLWDPRYIYIRTYWWGTWHGWYKIATELDLSALETAIVNNI